MCEIWRNYPLGNLCHFISGSGFPEHLQGQDNGDLPFYKVSDMSSPGNEHFLLNANNYVSREWARKRGWKTAPANAVVFAKVGAALLLNRRRMLSSESLFDNNMIAIIANEPVTNDWLYWQLLRVDFADFVQDGAVPSINQRQLGNILVPVVGAREAYNIVQILDTAIHETEAIIAKLKAVKQGMLHDLLTRGLDANGELRPPQAEAPNLYKESPLGWVPREWDLVSLESVSSNVTSGSRDWAHFYADSGALFVRIGNLTREHINFRYESIVFVRPPKNGDGQRTRLETGDILISITADLGIVGVVPEEMGEAYINQHIALVRPDGAAINSRFTGHYLAGPIAQVYISKLNDAGAKAGLNLPTIRGLLTATPKRHEQNLIAERLDEVDKRIQGTMDELAKLQKLKSGLMDDLLTGRVRVTPLLGIFP